MSSPPIRRRPPWARRLDALSGGLLPLARLLLPRPAEGALSTLARADRPGPVELPSAPDLRDPLEEGRAAFAVGRYGEALFWFGQLLEGDPRHPWAHHGRADALLLLGDADGAAISYRKAAEVQPQVGLHAAGLANALRALGQPDEAEEAWRRALRLDPTLTWMRPDR
jgi:tetratricopeptide (TPR) repeat protein